MFINCKHCGTLVATDPVTDQPPERCPDCRGVLRQPEAPAAISVASLLRTPLQPAPTAPPNAAVVLPAAIIPAAEPPATSTDAMDAVPVPAASPVPAPPSPAPAPAPASATPPTPEPEAAAHADPAPPVEQPAPAPGQPAAEATPASAAGSSDDTADESAPDAEASVVAPPSVASPSFARTMRAHMDHTPASRPLVAAVAALAVLLVLQILLADRHRLARDAAWRPAMTTLCGVLRCSLPAWHEPQALTLLARDVRPAPDRTDALVASATFRNDARWDQAWPLLRLTLSDINGAVVGRRVFTPAEYLPPDQADSPLPAGHEARLRLQLVEPEAHAVSFAFDFL